MAGNREYALPLNNPDTVSAEQATHLKETDLVIGLSIYGKARAYPWWIMSNYHVVNDTFKMGKMSQIPIMVPCANNAVVQLPSSLPFLSSKTAL